MIERLFVYGSLAPGRPNEHKLSVVVGDFEPASIKGTLHQEGWGAALGYPAVELDEHGDEIEGFLFSSENLSDHWQELDEFEGEAYERVRANVKLKDGRIVDAFVYALRVR